MRGRVASTTTRRCEHFARDVKSAPPPPPCERMHRYPALGIRGLPVHFIMPLFPSARLGLRSPPAGNPCKVGNFPTGFTAGCRPLPPQVSHLPQGIFSSPYPPSHSKGMPWHRKWPPSRKRWPGKPGRTAAHCRNYSETEAATHTVHGDWLCNPDSAWRLAPKPRYPGRHPGTHRLGVAHSPEQALVVNPPICLPLAEGVDRFGRGKGG